MCLQPPIRQQTLRRRGCCQIPLRTQLSPQQMVVPRRIDIAVEKRGRALHGAALIDILVAVIAAVQRAIIGHPEEREIEMRVLRVVEIEVIEKSLFRQTGVGGFPGVPLGHVAGDALAVSGGVAGRVGIAPHCAASGVASAIRNARRKIISNRKWQPLQSTQGKSSSAWRFIGRKTSVYLAEWNSTSGAGDGSSERARATLGKG